MISLVARIINIFTVTLRSALQVASLIGQVIVAISTAIIASVLNVFTNIIYFFQVIYEDNIFLLTEELPSFTNNIVAGITEQWMFLQDSLSSFCDGVSQKTSSTISTASWTINAVSTIVIEVLFLLKKSLILLGDTLWLIITFIPIHLPIILRSIFRYFKDIIISYVIDGYMALLKLTNFLTDVPLESCIGIISAIIIVRLCIHFKEEIKSQLIEWYWMIVRKALYLYHTVYNYFTDSEMRVITRIAPDRGAEPAPSSSNSEVLDDPSDALCVICQERHKCVLILPCRHVCLCQDCCLRLYGYQRTCPICRTFIYHSVNIYL